MRKALLALAVIGVGGVAGCADYPPPIPPGHVRWCLNHHPGYDPNTNLFPGADGRLHICRAHPPGFYGPPPPGPPPPPPPPPRY